MLCSSGSGKSEDKKPSLALTLWQIVNFGLLYKLPIERVVGSSVFFAWSEKISSIQRQCHYNHNAQLIDIFLR